MSTFEICSGLFNKHQLKWLLSVDQAFCESYTCIMIGAGCKCISGDSREWDWDGAGHPFFLGKTFLVIPLREGMCTSSKASMQTRFFSLSLQYFNHIWTMGERY